MFNIISFSNNSENFRYDKLYSLEKIRDKITNCKNLSEATKFKNRRKLMMIEDYKLEEGAIKIIAEKKKACFLIDFSKIINSYGVPRAILLSRLRTFLKLCVKHGAFYTFADFAKNEFELRSAQELMHISLLFGLNLGQAKFALKMLKHYLD